MIAQLEHYTVRTTKNPEVVIIHGGIQFFLKSISGAIGEVLHNRASSHIYSTVYICTVVHLKLCFVFNVSA